MALRDKLNNNPMIIAIAVIVLIAVAIWVTYRNVAPQTVAGGGVYFTDDDGKTYFEGSKSDFSPMEHNGKTAYRAYVYKCADGKPFVGFMEKMPEESIALLKKAKADPNSITNEEKGKMMLAGQMKQTKKPGEEKWQPARPIGMAIACPDGKPAQAAD